MKNMGYYCDKLTNFNFTTGSQKIDEYTFVTFIKSVLDRELGIEKSIIIDFSPTFPLSLNSKKFYEIFIIVFFDLFEEFKTEMGLDFISYFNVNFDLNENDNTEVIKRSKKSLILSPFEFYKVMDSYKNSYVNRSVLINLLHSDGRYESVLSINIDKLDLSQYYDPLTGEPCNEESTFNRSEISLFHENYIIDKRGFIIEQKLVKSIPSECINCRLCNKKCPAKIFPQFYYHYLDVDFIEEVENLLITKCTSCGICSFICPVHLPLTQKITEYLKEREV
jgi:NAD-dependent dihydropyrimidine dehydrogenase PreA subunit